MIFNIRYSVLWQANLKLTYLPEKKCVEKNLSVCVGGCVCVYVHMCMSSVPAQCHFPHFNVRIFYNLKPLRTYFPPVLTPFILLTNLAFLFLCYFKCESTFQIQIGLTYFIGFMESIWLTQSQSTESILWLSTSTN